MADHKKLSEKEEMYLVTIRKLCEHCTSTPIPIPDIARELNVQPVSVSQMINKLTENGYVNYIPYKGVELTDEGRDISSRILRFRRLWQVFLVKTLQMELDTADQLACQFEHYTTPDAANRLAKFLENPTVCFHGNPIYSAGDGANHQDEGMPIANLQIGQSSHVLRIDADTTTVKFLNDAGIQLGIEVSILALAQSGEILLESPSGPVQISPEVSSSIIVDGSPKMKGTKQ